MKLSGIYPDHEIRQFVFMLFEEYLGWTKPMVHLYPDTEIPEPVIGSLHRALDELITGKPIQYILGKSWFNGTLLKVDGNVLIPRPETEELCSMIKADLSGEQNRRLSILDIGTGSGCIAIDLKKYFTHSEVTAIDNSKGALKVAGENAVQNNCEIAFIHSDALSEANWKKLGTYHIIVSNPPYVTELERKQMHLNVTGFEPEKALFVSDNDPLMFYKTIAGFAVSHLKPRARLYFEINERYGKEVAGFVSALGYEEVRVLPDFHGKERFLTAVMKSRYISQE